MRTQYASDPSDPTKVIVSTLDDDEPDEVMEAVKPGPGLVFPDGTVREVQEVHEPEQEHVSWPAVAAYAALAISIGHAVLSAIR